MLSAFVSGKTVIYTFADIYETFVAGQKAALAKGPDEELEYIRSHKDAFAARFEVCKLCDFRDVWLMIAYDAACEDGVRLAENYYRRAETRARLSSAGDNKRKESSQRRVRWFYCSLR